VQSIFGVVCPAAIADCRLPIAEWAEIRNPKSEIRNDRARATPPLGYLISVYILASIVALAAADEEALWNAAWITDTQTPECQWNTTRNAMVQANKPELVIHTGDTRFEWANQCAWRAGQGSCSPRQENAQRGPKPRTP